MAVYVTSANGTNMIVGKSDNTTEATSSKTMGLIAQDLANNGFGYVITEGLLAGLDTSAASAGDPVWLGTNGGLLYGISNKPSAPAHMVFVGIVTRAQSNNGEIFVKVQNGFELEELHNVAISSIANNNLLMYESATSLWKNKTLAQIISAVLGNGTSGQLLQTDGSGNFSWGNNQGKIGSLKNTTQTSTTSATEVFLQSILIPANTFASGDSFNLAVSCIIPSGSNAGVTATNMRLNTANNLSGAQLLFSSAEGSGITLPNFSGKISIDTVGGTTYTRFGSIASYASPTASFTNINWAVNQYLIVSASVQSPRTKTFLQLIVTPL
jgi:hypothetical protein